LREFLKKLFCRHQYVKISWMAEFDAQQNIMYSVRMYKCKKCNKIIHVDGRRDPFDNVISHKFSVEEE